MADRKTRLRGDQVLDRSITKADLDATGETAGFVPTVQVDGSIDYTDTAQLAQVEKNAINIVLNAFRIAINGSLTQFNMVDGIVDEYEDESGIDNPTSTNEQYDSVNDLYSPVSSPSILTSPFAHMLMENNTDEGTGANAVTDIGTPTYTSGKLNNALTLDGSTDALNLDAFVTDVASDTTGSVAFWMNITSIGSTQYMFALGDTDGAPIYHISLTSIGKVQVSQNPADFTLVLDDALTTSTWIHVVVTQDGVEAVIYINGVAVPQTFTEEPGGRTSWFASTPNLDNGRIGCRNFNNNGDFTFFGGQIDDFRYYQAKALTSDEVLALYNSGTGTESDQVAGGAQAMTLQSNSFTAEAQPDNTRIVIFEEDVDSVSFFKTSCKEIIAPSSFNRISLTDFNFLLISVV